MNIFWGILLLPIIIAIFFLGALLSLVEAIVGFFKGPDGSRTFRFLLLFPIIFPFFIISGALFVIEEFLQVKNGPSLWLDTNVLDPVNNFIDHGRKRRCS